MTKQIAIISGSLRKASYSTRLAKVLAGLFPSGYNTELINIGDLPLTTRITTPKAIPRNFIQASVNRLPTRTRWFL